jgi:exodeoxyribonuclease V alpha subunit
MLDQDTARALLTIADQAGARVALVGDRHQLPAVGRGGVLDLASCWAQRDARVDLDTVHRFVRTMDGQTAPDTEYAKLSLAMRAGDDPGAVFDALLAGGHIAVHASEVGRSDALADHITASRLDGGGTATVVVDTREHAATLNSTIRGRLVATGAVDNRRVAITHDGQRIGAGDAVVTRRNDHDLGVANRQLWTVTRVHRDGRLTVDDAERGRRELPAEYVRGHAELGYTVTGYGAQGDTTTEAHLVLTHTTTAAAAYVAMTRGRTPTPRILSPPTSMTPGTSGSPRSAATGPTSDPPLPARRPLARRPATAHPDPCRTSSPTCAAPGPTSAPHAGNSNTCRPGSTTPRHRPPGRHTAGRP